MNLYANITIEDGFLQNIKPTKVLMDSDKSIVFWPFQRQRLHFFCSFSQQTALISFSCALFSSKMLFSKAATSFSTRISFQLLET